MKIKFRLEKFTQPKAEDKPYGIIFKIIEQDMNHNPLSKFVATNGFSVNTNYYPYILENVIYLNSTKPMEESIKKSDGCVAISFSGDKEREDYIKRLLEAIEEWSK